MMRKNKLLLLPFFMLMIYGCHNSISKIETKTSLKLKAEIDSLQIDNVIYEAHWGRTSTVFLYLKLEIGNISDYKLYIPKNFLSWVDTIPTPYMWCISGGREYNMEFYKYIKDTLLYLPSKSQTILTAKIILDSTLLVESLYGMSINSIQEMFRPLFNEDFVVKMFNRYDNDTIEFKRSQNFSISYKLDDVYILPDDSINMNKTWEWNSR